MKPVLRLVKQQPAAEKKAVVRREQRFRYPAEEVWEASCRPARNGDALSDEGLSGEGSTFRSASRGTNFS